MPLALGYGIQPLRGIRLAATNEIRPNLELLNFNGRSGFLLETSDVSRAITWTARHKNSCLFVFIRGFSKY